MTHKPIEVSEVDLNDSGFYLEDGKIIQRFAVLIADSLPQDTKLLGPNPIIYQNGAIHISLTSKEFAPTPEGANCRVIYRLCNGYLRQETNIPESDK